MIPLLINTFDKGGAAKACLRLHEGLLREGINSKVLLKAKTENAISNTHQISIQTLNRSFKTKTYTKARNILKEFDLNIEKSDTFLKSRPQGLEMFSYPTSEYDITKSELYREANIINLHWVADFLDYTSFFRKNKKPVIWTLHDQNPFLGLEHYSETLLGISENGYPMKRELLSIEKRKHEEFTNIKRSALDLVENLTIVAPSVWLAEEAQKSMVFKKFKTKVIPYGLNSNIFKPLDKVFCREILNIPINRTVILFVSESISNKRKGFEFLERAFEQLKNDDLILLSIGSKNERLTEKNNHRELGHISDERLLSIVYSAADVFVIPSLMDNLPNTVLESIMCGTPVIGFPVGGIRDMIQDGKNGYLAKEISVPDLTKSIERFLNDTNAIDRDKIRRDAVKKYDLSVQANAYIELYKEIYKNSKVT